MSTRVTSLAPTNSTDALFRAWISEFHNSLIAFGWVQASDSGQVNYSTVLKPAAVSTYPGFAIYRMDDALQSTCPVYLRLDYGSGSSSADICSLKVQVAIGGTDGVGNLTGIKTTQITTSSAATASSTLSTCRTSGDTSSCRLHLWGTSTTTNGFTLIIERDRDSTGAETALGVNVLFMYSAGISSVAKFSQFIAKDGSVGTQDSVWYGMVSQATSQSADGVVGIGPVHCQLGVFRNPMLSAFLCSRTDFTLEQTYTVAIYGEAHTYIMLRPNPGGTTPLLNLVNSDTGFGMLWE